MNPVQLNESSVIDAIDTPGQKFRDQNLEISLKKSLMRFLETLFNTGERSFGNVQYLLP